MTEKRALKIYCPTHKIGFTVVAAETLMCESGEHALTEDFPTGEFWEYCCDCQQYWPSDAGTTAKGRERCPLCERPSGLRYLCDQCKVQSYDSGEAAGRKAYSISTVGAVEPACPGCLSHSRAKLRTHQCDEGAQSFITAREVCPFCEEPIGEPPSFPSTVADCLSKLKAKLVEVTFEAQKARLVSSPGGEFVLVHGGNAPGHSIVIPRATRFETGQDYSAYEGFYQCAAAAPGEVWVVRPAVVEKTDGGWKLRDVGRLDVKLDAPAPLPATGPQTPFDPGVIIKHCPQCGTAADATNVFCGGCGYRFDAEAVPDFDDTLDGEDEGGAAEEISKTSETPGVDDSDTSAEPAPPGKRPRAVVAILGVAAVLALVITVAVRSGASLENKLDKAIDGGQLFAPQGASAFDYYRQLKNQGASPAVIARFDSRLMPLLTAGPRQMLVEFARPGTDEPSQPQWEEAYKQLSWASQIKPGDGPVAARASYCLGRIAYLNDRKDDAFEAWKKASDLDASWAVATNGVGLIHNERKEYEAARPYLREAIRRDPNWAIPYNNLGTSYYYKQRYDEAETYYAKAVELSPAWGRPHAWLGDIAKYRGDYARAVQEYEIVLDPATVGTSRMDLGAVRRRLEEVRRLASQNNQ